MIDYLLLIVLALVTGMTVKYADILEDDRKHESSAKRIAVGVVYGVLLFVFIRNFEFLAPLWIGTVLGLLVIGKIDAPAHYTGILTMLVLFFIYGLSHLDIPLLLVFAAACVLEEILNDWTDRHPLKNRKLHTFLQARPLLEITAFFVSLITGTWAYWIALLSFDVGYIGTAKFIR